MKNYILISLLLSSCNILDSSRYEVNNQLAKNNQTNNRSNNANTNQTNNKSNNTTNVSFELPNTQILGKGRSKDGLVALWDFSDTTKEILDKSGHVPPLDLVGEGELSKLEDRNGIKIGEGGMMTSTSASFMFAEITSHNAFTIETWIKPKDLEQIGPARIITMSQGSRLRNFTLAQENAALVIRLRTEDASRFLDRKNGIEDVRIFESVKLDVPSHYVWTYNGSNNELWVDGELRSSTPLPGGLGDWNPAFQFRIGNEFASARQWQGDIYFLSIYNRALKPIEIAHHFSLGNRPDAEKDETYDPLHVKTCDEWPFDLHTTEAFEMYKKASCSSVKGSVHLVGPTRKMIHKLEGVQRIGGDLILDDIDAINLKALEALTSIGGNLVIKNNRLLERLEALSNLSELGGDLDITNNDALRNCNGFSGLSAIKGSLIINHNSALNFLGLEFIQTIDRALVINDSPDLLVLEMTQLKETQSMSISRCDAPSLNFPKLTKLNEIWIRDMKNLKRFELPVLAKAFHFYRNEALFSITLNTEPSSSIYIAYNPSLNSFLSLNELTEIEDFVTKNNDLTRLKLDGLVKVRRRLEIESETLTTLKGEFPKLEHVGEMFFQKDTALLSFKDAFPNLETLTNLHIRALPKLLDINSGFQKLTKIHDIKIVENRKLSDCDAKAFLTRLAISGKSTLTHTDVLATCN